MASEKNLEAKKKIVNEIVKQIKDAEAVVIFAYQGLTVSSLSELRRGLRNSSSEVKIYKNTLLKRALDELKINLDDFLAGPNAILFGSQLLESIKTLADFAKKNKKLDIRVGIISGDVASLETIKEYAEIPSREGLLTMLAGGMMQYVRDLSVGLNMYADSLEK
ncbi:MAG TPA: 50S ribosomal protein L10 [Bacilli bacterium]|nr:50S ribosomal protein L10 [Bacilli bacterium]